MQKLEYKTIHLKKKSWILIFGGIILFVILVFIISGGGEKKEDNLAQISQPQNSQEQQMMENKKQETEQEQAEKFEQDKEIIRSFYREVVAYDAKVANYFTTAREKISQTSDHLLYQALITAKQNMEQYAIEIGLVEVSNIYDKDDQKQLKSAISLLALAYDGRSGYFGYYAKALDEITSAGVQKKKNQAVALGEQAHVFEMEAIEKLVEILNKYGLTDEY